MLASSGKFLAAHKGTKNIGITGPGIIDGAGRRESVSCNIQTFLE